MTVFKIIKEAKDEVVNMREAQILSIKTRDLIKKNIMFGGQKSLNRLNSRLDTAKDTISELEGGYKQINQGTLSLWSMPKPFPSPSSLLPHTL